MRFSEAAEKEENKDVMKVDMGKLVDMGMAKKANARVVKVRKGTRNRELAMGIFNDQGIEGLMNRKKGSGGGERMCSWRCSGNCKHERDVEKFNRFELLREEDEVEEGEINQVDELVEEIVEVTVDSGAARNVWPA